MKYIITESQLKKSVSNAGYQKGKFGGHIEKLVFQYLDPSKICDVVCFETSKNEYMLMLMFNGYVPFRFETELTEYIKSFLPISLVIFATDSKCDK